MTRLKHQKERASAAFLCAFGIACVMFLPFIIADKGYFVFYGDFNVQQIPFYQMAHDAVLSGNVFWSWTTDLGANFIGSYSFYLLGSPFFWLTLPFSSDIVPYLMAPLLIIKLSCASWTAYLFLRRFAQPNSALLGALLYAFSGYSMYNMFFNHFHEALIYFPLMLIGIERIMADGRKGLFCLTVFLSALSNFYFFIGQVFFLIIYWVIRSLSGEWRVSFPKFLTVLLEAVIGIAMAAVVLLPAFYCVSQNPRTENMLTGWDLLIYNKPQRILDILHSFFFPQDIPARAAFFPDSANKWSSMSAWLPVFGGLGLVAYLQSRPHRDWLRRILIVCLFCSFIPVLNSMFQLFNNIYYARWFYMMVLMLSLATVKCFDTSEDAVEIHWPRAFGWTIGIVAAMAAAIGLIPNMWRTGDDETPLKIGLFETPELFFIAISIAAICLVLSGMLILVYRKDRSIFMRTAIITTALGTLLFGVYSIAAGKATANYKSSYVIDNAINSGGKSHLDLPEITEGRVDFNSDMDNMGMHWQTPTIQAFHSVVPGSIMEFYPTVGVERSVASRPDTTHYALRGLLSVQWLFDYDNKDGSMHSKHNSFNSSSDPNKSGFFDAAPNSAESSPKMPGWSYYDTQNGYYIYKNDYYIPYGFTYEYFQTRTEYESLPNTSRELSLLRAIVVEDNDMVIALSAGLKPANAMPYTLESYLTDCEARRETAAHDFRRDNNGFEAVINLPSENLVFFSVPHEAGWSASVNGNAADIHKVNVGFMAVSCPAGENVVIRFDYMTPGLLSGIKISGIAAAVYVIYLLILVIIRRKKQNKTTKPEEPFYENLNGFRLDRNGSEGDSYRIRTTHTAAAAFPLDMMYQPEDDDK